MGQHFLAARRGVKADHVHETLRRQDAARPFGVARVSPIGIGFDRLECKWKSGVRVDLADRQHGPVTHRATDRGVGPGRGEQQANADSAAFAHVAALSTKKAHRLSPRASSPFPQLCISCASRLLLHAREARKATYLELHCSDATLAPRAIAVKPSIWASCGKCSGKLVGYRKDDAC